MYLASDAGDERDLSAGSLCCGGHEYLYSENWFFDEHRDTLH
jgi:hypothetical protein